MQRDVIRATRAPQIRRYPALALLGFLLSACGGSAPTTPTPTQPAPTIASITPPSGTTAGGTEVTLTGTNFVTGVTVTIGGVAATNVRVLGTTNIVAVTGAHAAGVTDVVVVQGAQIATLASAYTYVAPPVPTVTSVAPTLGPVAGGTPVTITGTNFADGATVTIGGVAATGVRVTGPTAIQAVTPARAAGVADVAVTVGTQTATLPSAFTFLPPAANTLPVITALGVQGSLPNEPPNYANLAEEITLSATVQDAETPVDQLQYEWSGDGGTFTGSGPVVRWRAPAAASTPLQIRVGVRVTEVIGIAGAGAMRNIVTQSVTASSTVRVHDSLKEIIGYSVQFLLDFSNSNLAPAYVVREFYDGCAGKADELSDVQNNRTRYIINSYRIGTPTVATVAFKGTCRFRSKKGDACVETPVEWRSTDRITGTTETAIGLDQTTMVYRDSRWWICESDFDGRVTNPLAAIPFIR